MTSTDVLQRDQAHWLYRLSPQEWITGAVGELKKAERASSQRNAQGLVAGVKRAAGMALNAALVMRSRESWGRTYVEHLAGLSEDERVPQPVRQAARVVREAQAPSSGLVVLRSRKGDEALLEAGRIVMAHAYAVVYGSQTREET
jgi:hypothetical protein